jgi:hypothetical protein
MSESDIDQLRRRALKAVVASGVAIPTANLALRGSAVAGDLPRLSEDDRAAKALGYVHDAKRAPAGKRKEGT